MRRSPGLAAVCLALLAALWGCGADGGGDLPSGPPASTRSSDAPQASYRPPADRLLRPEQVSLFLSVLERAVASPGPASVPATDEAPDAAAAREAGANVEEFTWIRERVLEAEAAVATAKLNSDVLAMLERTLAELRARREGAADDGSRTLLDEQIAQFQTELERVRREARVPEPAHVQRNVRILAPHRARIGELQAELDRRLASLRPATARPRTGP